MPFFSHDTVLSMNMAKGQEPSSRCTRLYIGLVVSSLTSLFHLFVSSFYRGIKQLTFFLPEFKALHPIPPSPPDLQGFQKIKPPSNSRPGVSCPTVYPSLYYCIYCTSGCLLVSDSGLGLQCSTKRRNSWRNEESLPTQRVNLYTRYMWQGKFCGFGRIRPYILPDPDKKDHIRIRTKRTISRSGQKGPYPDPDKKDHIRIRTTRTISGSGQKGPYPDPTLYVSQHISLQT